MSESFEHRAAAAFTPGRFAVLLGLLVFAMFPQVILGMETFVARDFGFFAYPLAHFEQDCLRQGHLPFWNPYNNCGVPFLAQWNTMALYPPLLVCLKFPLTWSLSFFSLAHLWWAGLGMYFLARRWTGSNFAAAFAGTVFAFNGLTLNLVMWPSHIATFSWMAWVVLAAELAWREGGRRIFIAGIVGALQMLAGGPEPILFTWLILLALWAQQFVKAETPRRAMLWRLPSVVGLVIVLSAAQLLPFLDLVAHAQREAGYTDLRWSMPGFGLANFLVPMAFGNTVTEGIFFQHGQYWTSSYYLGIGTLWLALLAGFCVRQRRVGLLAGIAIIALLCALGENTPVYPLIRKVIPQLSFVTYPVKFVMFIVFAVPLLAAFALANVSQLQKRLWPVGGVLLGLVGAVVLWTQLSPLTGDDLHVAVLLNGISRAVFLILTGLVLYTVMRPATTTLLRLAPLALVLVAWLDVFTHEPKQNPTVPPVVFEQNLARAKLAMNPQPELGGSRAMLSPAAALELTRFGVADPQNNFLAKRIGLCADANLLDNVPKVDGFFSLTPGEFDNFLGFVYTATNGDWSRLQDFLGVSQVTAPDKLIEWQPREGFHPLVTAGQRPVFLGNPDILRTIGRGNFDGAQTVFLQTNDQESVTVTNQTEAKIISSKFNFNSVEVEVDAAEPSLVVVAQTYYHNWNAMIGERTTPILRANAAFQAVQVPAGRNTIHFFYSDLAFERGAYIAGLGWVVSLAALLILRRPAKKI